MAPFKSTLARSAGKSLGVYSQQDLSLRGIPAAGAQTNDNYLFIPFNENSTSHTLFGEYSPSITTSSGGTYNTSTHPYSISDSTYNSGNTTSYRCQDDCDVFRVTNTNTILGSLQTSDFCFDVWFNWRATGNGDGSYGQIGDYSFGGCSQSSTTNHVIMIGMSGSLRYTTAPALTGDRVLTGATSLNVWYHYMLIRQSGIFYAFKDGVLNLLNSSDTSLGIFNNGKFNFGGLDRGAHYWNVNFSDFMFTKGSTTQYTLTDVTSGDIGSTFFTTPKYKNKVMADSVNDKFVKSHRPTGFN